MKIGKALATIGLFGVVFALMYFKVGCWNILASGLVIVIGLAVIWEDWS